MIGEVATYVAPLLSLDILIVKKYAGCDFDELTEKRTNWLQVYSRLNLFLISY